MMKKSNFAGAHRAGHKLSRILCFGVLLMSFVAGVSVRSAHADSPIKGSVLPLKVMSDVLDDKRIIALTTVLSEKLRAYPKHKVLAPPVADVLELLMEYDCIEADSDCLQQIGSQNKADAVVFVSVSKEKKKYVLAYQVHDVSASKQLSSGTRTTTTLSALPGALERAIKTMFGEPPSAEPAPVALTVTSSASEARVFLNGRDIGVVPVTTKVLPGKGKKARSYSLRVERKGYEVWKKDIAAKSGSSISINAKLTPIKVVVVKEKPDGNVAPKKNETKAAPVPVSAATPIYQKWWFWTATGVVVVGAVTAILLAVNSDSGGDSGGLLISLDPAQVENDAIFRNQ